MIGLFLAAILYAANFALSKYYQNMKGSAPYGLLMFNAGVSTCKFIIFFIAGGFILEVNGFSFIMAFLYSMALLAYTMIGFKIMENAKVALYTVFLMAGGMMLPYIWGLIFLDEAYSSLRTIGLLIMALSMVVSNYSKEKMNLKTTMLCISVFILNGFVSIISKEHQISSKAVSTESFIAIANIILAVSAYILALRFKNVPSDTPKPAFSWKVLMALVLSAAASGTGYFLQLIGSINTPATVIFPIITGGTVIFSAVAGLIFFKEKITKNLAIGLLLCIVGTCMFL